MPKAYLTIDDSPSGRSDDLVDFLVKRDIPALLFVRGDRLEENPAPVVRAIQNGMTIGNHSYAHKPAGDLGFEAWRDDFEKIEALIDKAYRDAGHPRPGLYYRFPYIDRGDGVRVERVFAAGGQGGFEENELTLKFQDHLKVNGFSQPFQNMPQNYPTSAADCLFTYTVGDWMLTPRHKGKWDYKSVEDLKTRIDEDENLKGEEHNHVLLLHDQADIHDEVCALIDYFVGTGFKFLDL